MAVRAKAAPAQGLKNVKIIKLSLVMGLGFAISACSTFKRANYRESALGNMNPAPSQMTPPDYVSDSAPPVWDQTYMSSQADYHFTMGETLSYEGQSARAAEEFKLTLIYDPKSIHVRLRLAAEYVRLGMATEGLEQAEIAVEMDPKSIEARMLLGGLYAGLKMFGPSRAQFEAVLENSPGHSEASIYLGAIYAEERKYDEAIKHFTQLSRNLEFEDRERAFYYIGRVRAEQGADYSSEAQAAFTRALELKPEYPEAALALAMLLRSQGKKSEMEKLLRSYQDKFGPEREFARHLSQYYLEIEDFDKALGQLEILESYDRENLNVKIQMALILIEQKKFETAATRLEDVLHQAPDSDKVRYYLGAVYEEIGRADLAIANYKKIGPASSYYPDAVIHAAHLYRSTNRLDGAVKWVETALSEPSEHAQIYAYYATLLDEQRKYKKAQEMLSGVVERFPENTQLRFFLGTMFDRLGNSKATIEQMSKVLEIDKDHIQAMNYLAYTFAELGRNLEEAQALAARALDLQPQDGYILDTMGWVHFKRGQMEEAIRYLEAAYKMKSDEAIIAEHLGDAYLRHQMWQKAQKMYQKASSLESKSGTRQSQIQQKIINLQAQIQTVGRRPASLPTPDNR